MYSIRDFGLSIILVVGVLSLAGCQTIREVTQLRNVDFQIDRVTETTLANVPVERLQNYGDLSAAEVLRLSNAAASGEVPLDFTLQLRAENPSENNVAARLVEMDWTLFLNDTETISGVFDGPTTLSPGVPQIIGIPVRVDLVQFFGRNLRDLVNVAQAVSGRGEAQVLELKAQPTIQTAIGPIRYPNEISIVRRAVGGEEATSEQ